MRTVLWLIYEVLYLVIAIPEMIRCRRMYRRGEKERLRSVAKIRVRNWARSMLRFAGVTHFRLLAKTVAASCPRMLSR